MAITDATHGYYRQRKRSWQLIRRMMTGEDIEAELTQRYFEHLAHFKQRRKDSRGAEPLTGYLISRLAGILFQKGDDVSRELGGLSEDDLEAAGPMGEDYRVVLMKLAETLLAYDEALVVLRPGRGLSVVPPLQRPNWNEMASTITGTRTLGGDISADVDQVSTWTVYRPGGWAEYRQPREDEATDQEDVEIARGTYAPDRASEEGQPGVFFVDPSGRPMPPVLHIKVPWSVRLGWVIAKMHRDIYEMTSRRDFHVSSAMNGMIQLGVGGDADLSDVIEGDLKRGARFIPYDSEYGEHKGLEMPVEGAALGSEIIEDKRKSLRRVAYDQLDEAARQTATQAKIEQQGGAAAALSVLAETMADAEMRILHMWNQAKDMTLAGPDPRPIDVGCSWPTDYSKVFDEQDLARDIFPDALPADLETATEVLMDYYAQHGQAPDRDQLRRKISQGQAREAMERRRQELAAQADERALAAEEQINGEATE
jgi:hypothetical protein